MRNANCEMRNAAMRKMMLRISFCLLPSAFCLSLSGCNVVGIAAAKVVGPPDVPAKYVVNKDEPMLVLVESYRQSGFSHDAEQLARHVVDELEQYHVAPTINLMSLYTFREQQGESKYATMTIPEIGRAMGAAQVLYVDVLGASIESSGGTEVYDGRMTVRVRIVDSATGKTRWPLDAEGGYPIVYEPRFEGFGTNTNPNAVRQQTYSGLAYYIVRNFRKWKPDNLQEEEMQQSGMGG